MLTLAFLAPRFRYRRACRVRPSQVSGESFNMYSPAVPYPLLLFSYYFLLIPTNLCCPLTQLALSPPPPTQPRLRKSAISHAQPRICPRSSWGARVTAVQLLTTMPGGCNSLPNKFQKKACGPIHVLNMATSTKESAIALLPSNDDNIV